jgi:hypothetical protein
MKRRRSQALASRQKRREDAPPTIKDREEIDRQANLAFSLMTEPDAVAVVRWVQS